MKKTLGTMVAIAVVAILIGTFITVEHATAGETTGKSEPIVYSQLPHNKIQPPKEGCFVGLFKHRFTDDPATLLRIKEINAMTKNISEFAETIKRENIFANKDKEIIIRNISYYKDHLDAKPFLFVLLARTKLYLDFPKAQSIELAKRGVVPYVNACIGQQMFEFHKLELTDIISGQYDRYIREFAEGALAFGKAYGGFFFTTMEEANGLWYSWAGNRSNYISAWRHIWEIFEKVGANQYATWVWEAYCPEGTFRANDPEDFYPGDKYVDWIGINAYSVAGYRSTNKSLNALMNTTYRKMQKNHPQKPIMLSEFARTNEYEQRLWIQDAYSSLKNEFPAIKAAIYYDNVWTLTGDHTLSPGGLEEMKDIFKDPYWIKAK